ncbi:cyclic GMP-AMP synthase-like receptor [Cydia splendana]|uniref:cyclic GMP-AMP synthase-like receptor n=1 Tax=Cydia splendana TaxID=1100963 RepID=UPI00300CF139
MVVFFTDHLRAQGAQIFPLKPEVKVPAKPVIKSLNSLLHDIYVRFIALRDKDFEKYYNVFETIFFKLHELMKEADPYYKQYTSNVLFAGSHYDKLRINKPDEFDMDIVIGLPVNADENPQNPAKSDVVMEDIAPGFVRLKMGKQFQNLPNRDQREDWEINQTAYKWLDDDNYLLRSQFMYWFKSVVDKAMNLFDQDEYGEPYMDVEGTKYTLRLSASGPAYTLIIEDKNSGFRLDVDLVPALKFPEDRWPITKKYRRIPKRCKKDFFMVVPKPLKGGRSPFDSDRSWRLAMHIQEKDLMYDTCHMKQVIRLIKKLRDSLGMDKIASYYIKTIFYHEAIEREHDEDFWSRNSPADLFIHMVKKFLQYLEMKNIPYFWNPENNLIEHINDSTLTSYANQLKQLVKVLDNLDDPSNYKKVAKFLLTKSQFELYRKKILRI